MSTNQDNPYKAGSEGAMLPEPGSPSRRFSLWDGIVGGILGVPTLLGLMTVSTGVLGGVLRAAPCHSAPDFTTGAMFGVLAGYYLLGIPTVIAGAIGGVLWGGFRRRRGVQQT